MKKTIFQISSFYLTFVFCLISYGANSQNLKSTKTTRIEAKKIERNQNYQDLVTSLESRRFMIGMENQLTQIGNRTGLSPVLNYIMVDSSSCVWQSEFDDIISAYDDKVISKVEGRIESWKLVKVSKNLSCNMRFIMVTNNGPYQVFVTINSDKTASGNLSSAKTNFSFYGKIVIL